jgi:hypothetical protein
MTYEPIKTEETKLHESGGKIWTASSSIGAFPMRVTSILSEAEAVQILKENIARRLNKLIEDIK